MDVDSYNKIKNSLRVLNLRIDGLTDKNNPEYRAETTDNMYTHFKNIRQNIKMALDAEDISEDEKKDLIVLLDETDKFLVLLRPAISDQLMDLEGGSRRRKSSRKRKCSRRRKSSKRRKCSRRRK